MMPLKIALWKIRKGKAILEFYIQIISFLEPNNSKLNLIFKLSMGSWIL
jgi:hypothetical protein